MLSASPLVLVSLSFWHQQWLEIPHRSCLSLNQATLLNVSEPALIQPEESFHLPPYTPKLSILAMEINSHLSAILKWDFFNSEPKDAENHALIRIRITESGAAAICEGTSLELDLFFIK